MAKINLWKEQENFSKYILKYILNLLVSEKFTFNTTIWNYQLAYIDEKWTSEWWSQLTDKILKLHIKNLSNNDRLITYLYIESKAYFSESSESITSIQKSFREFYTKLWNDFWYASMYCIFKWWETYWIYPYLDKLIEDVDNCPEMYFEITKELFENSLGVNSLGVNSLEELLNSTFILTKNNEKKIKYDEYINNSFNIIENLKIHLKNNIELSFSEYEKSEKRINVILNNLKQNNQVSIDNLEKNTEKWFKFDSIKRLDILEKAEREQSIYLLNKVQYFKNPLIRKNIEDIEKYIKENTFCELDGLEYLKLEECTNNFIEEFWEITFANEKQKKIKEYLFEWWKKQKRWFLFDCWSNEECLFHYKKDDKILFLNKNKDV